MSPMAGEATGVGVGIGSAGAGRVQQLRHGSAAFERDKLQISRIDGAAQIASADVTVVVGNNPRVQGFIDADRMLEAQCSDLVIVVQDGGMTIGTPLAHPGAVVDVGSVAFAKRLVRILPGDRGGIVKAVAVGAVADTTKQAVIAAAASCRWNFAIRSRHGNCGAAAPSSTIAASVGIMTTDTAEVACRVTPPGALLFIGVDAETEICRDNIVSMTGCGAGSPGPGKGLGQPVEISAGRQGRTVKAEHGRGIIPTGSGMASKTNRAGIRRKQQ